jgi:hypothetical protein
MRPFSFTCTLQLSVNGESLSILPFARQAVVVEGVSRNDASVYRLTLNANLLPESIESITYLR